MWILTELWELNTESEGWGSLGSFVKGMLSPAMVALAFWRFQGLVVEFGEIVH